MQTNNTLATINSLLVDVKTINNSLLIQLQKADFNTQLHFGPDDEYNTRTLIQTIETMVIHFLTITANRHQFLQRTSLNERLDIEYQLKQILLCLKQTQIQLDHIKTSSLMPDDQALTFMAENGENTQLALKDCIQFIDALKPYSRMLELVIAQERIHALSAVLETLLHTPPSADHIKIHEESDLATEQQEALELSHYFIKQAL